MARAVEGHLIAVRTKQTIASVSGNDTVDGMDGARNDLLVLVDVRF